MAQRALRKKLWRELGGLKGQIVTIALVLASGIASFIMLRGTFDSLERSRDLYYDRYHFADVFLKLERAPESMAERVAALPGVAAIETRIAESVLVPIEGMSKPAYAQLLSLPSGRAPVTNGVHLEQGRLPERGREDEALLLESFAKAHGLLPGHRLPAVIQGKLRRLHIVGIARSPEFVYALRPGAMIADPKRSAVLWMDRTALGRVFQLESGFNELSLRLQPGASEVSVRNALDRLFVPYGGYGAFARKYQLSHRILKGELDQLSGIAGLVPLVFLGVTAFLMRLVLGRLIALSRSSIATLKAIGYSDREVGRHYLALAEVVLLPGSVLGIVGGYGLGRVVLGLYAPTFRFPDLTFRLSAPLVLVAVLASCAAALGGAWLAVRAAVKLPPAEALRPPAPPRYRRGLLDWPVLLALAGPSGTMVLRELQRRPLRWALSGLGIAGAVALVVLGRFGLDSIDKYLEDIVGRSNRQDLAVTFGDSVPPRAVQELARMPGVLAAEGVRSVPIRVRHEHRMRESMLIGLSGQSTLHRLIDRDGRERDVPEEGVLITKTLGEILRARVGDRLEIELREGERPVVQPVISGYIDEAAGLQVYARADRVAQLAGDQGAVSSVLLSVDGRELGGILRRLRESPRVLAVSELSEEIQRERDQHDAVFRVWTTVSVLLAGAVIFGVVYNNARISLTARSRDLASLRVLGFSRREISLMLLAELGLQVAFAIPLGLVLGRLWADQMMASIDQESFRWAGMVSLRTYAMATLVTLSAAAVSALWVRRSLDRLDLISVLKSHE
jgi:putative ABC transport system permease protein